VLFAHVFWGVSLFFDTGIYITKKTYLKTWHGITAAVCLGLYLLLIPRYCMVGAAWATVGTYFVFAALSWYLNEKALPANYEFGKMLRVILPGVALYLVNLQLETWETQNFGYLHSLAPATYPLLYFVVVVAIKFVLLLMYLPLIHLLRVLDAEDFERIREFYKDLKSKVSGRDSARRTPPPQTHLE
jgi:hypothetical protein